MTTPKQRPFTWRQILIIAAVFGAVIIALQRTLRYVCENCVSFDCPYYWPISIFSPRLPALWQIGVAMLVVTAFYGITRGLEATRFKIALVCLSGCLLIGGLTLVHGVDIGFYTPIGGDARSGVLIPFSLDGQEYFHDALRVTDAGDFFRRYNEIQPTLSMHGHTHPPGAIMTFYFLYKILGDAALMSIAIMLAATTITAVFFYKILRVGVGEMTAGYTTFLLVLLPVVQIYYLATLDALVAALLTATLYFFCFGKGTRAVVAATLLLTASFLLTFVCLFILPVLVGFDVLVKRSVKRAVIVIGGMVAIYSAIYLTTGYNAWQSFRAASLYENPNGPMMLVNPVNYLFTRFEDVAEIIVFLGPFLSVLFIRGVRAWRSTALSTLTKFRPEPFHALTLLGCVTLAAMYVAGAWRTGETARAGAFIYPYLLLPVAEYLESLEMGSDGRLQLAALVFLQSVGMQLIGNFHW